MKTKVLESATDTDKNCLVVVLEIAIYVFFVVVMMLWFVWFISVIWYMLSVSVADSNTLVFMGYPIMM